MDLGIESKRGVVYLAAFVVSLFIGLLVSFAYERGASANRVVRGITIDGAPVAGLDEPRLKRLLAPRRRGVGEAALELSLDEARLSKKARDLGVALNDEGAIRRALLAGREGGIVGQFGFWLGRLFSDREIGVQLTVDEKKLGQAVAPWAKEKLSEPRLPEIRFEKELLIERGRAGQVVDFEALRKKLLQRDWRSSAQGDSALAIPTRKQEMVVSTAAVEEAEARARALVRAPIEVKGPGGHGRARLSPRALGGALRSEVDEAKGMLNLTLDMDELRKSLREFLAEHERPAVSASFEFSPSGEPKLLPSETGSSLDEAHFLKEIWRASREGERSVEIRLEEAAPELTTEQAEGLGIKGVVSSFSTRHACCQPRVENIHHAAAKLDGVILRPGEKFSLNEFLGPRHRSTGYEKAPTIVHGEMKEVYGGGISQLATTLFNVALRGGYEIIQRQPHSVWFPRYPEGHEATVSFPEPDLIFRNDTEAGIVIKTQAAPTYIRIIFYGDNGGRVTTVNKSQRYNIVEPPKEYEPDEEMPPEKSKRLQAGQLGWTVLVSRKVKYPDGTVKEEKREVVYNPRPEVLRVHPCVIPEGEEGHTGEKCPEPKIEEKEEELSEDVYYETL